MNDPIVKFLWSLLRQQKKQISQAFLCLIFMGVGHGALLTLMGPFIQSLTGQEAKIPQWATWLLNTDMSSPLIQVPGAMIFAGFIKTLGSYGYQWVSACIAIQMTSAYRKQLFAGLLFSEYEWIQQKTPGAWMSILMNDAQILQKQVVESLSASVRDTMLILASWGTLAIIYPAAAFSLLLIGPILAYGMGRVGTKISHFADHYQRLMSELSSIFFDQRQRFDIIRSQHGEKKETLRFEHKNDQHFSYIRRSIFIRSSFAPILEWLGFCVFAGWIWQMNNSAASPLQGESLILFFAALGSMLRPLKGLGEQVSKLQEVSGILQNGQALLTRKQTPHSLIKKALPLSLFAIHLNREKFSLNIADIDLTPRTIAIIGQSGSGKSTFARILGSLTHPTSWQASIPWDTFCTHVTMVSQKPFLFTGSLQENLFYGLKRQPSQKEIDHALWIVDMKDYIYNLPQQLETPIQTFQSGFSGGQLQRLTLARGLLNQTAILVVDEITSSLDQACEKLVISRLIDFCKERQQLLIAITHRLSWLHQSDDVWWMENGKIKKKGKHHDLQQHPIYCDFIQTTDRKPHLEAIS